MELKEYIAIFKKYSRLFFIVVILAVVAGVSLELFQPLTYKSNLTLNVTRSGIQETPDYRFDDFYRLQADERFADTVVRWLGSPRVVTDIYNEAGIVSAGLSQRSLSRIFKAQRLSSQVIQVIFATSDSRIARNISNSIIKILNKKTEELNNLQKEESWFIIIGSDPVIRENKWAMEIVVLASLLAGAFLGMLAVLVKNYFED
ncbi:MAG: hypothetical protein NT136_03345 [Candidatus Moranbacteria bacterium]|nr:hypothetical protein [Candidatus Moranbacteria bacterium]